MNLTLRPAGTRFLASFFSRLGLHWDHEPATAFPWSPAFRRLEGASTAARRRPPKGGTTNAWFVKRGTVKGRVASALKHAGRPLAPPRFVAVMMLWFASTAWAAPAEDILAQLRQFRYGQDAAVLTDVENRVASATASAANTKARQQLARDLAAILETDATYEAKQFVCRQLAKIATVQQVPILARMLTDDKLSDMARYALAPIPDRSVDPALRAALDQTTGKTRIGIVNSLGFRRDPQAVKPLGKLLNDPDAGVAGAAAAALGRIGGVESAALLKRALQHAAQESRFGVADAYLACAEDFAARNDQPRAVAIYRDLFQPDEPVRTRVAAFRGLAANGGAAGLRIVLDGLHDPAPVIHRAALGCIRLLPGGEALRRIAVELPRLSVPDQVVVLGALGDRGDRAVLAAAQKAAKSPDARVRLAACEALGKLGDASSVPFLAQTVRVKSDPAERDAALEALRGLHGSGVDEAVLREMLHTQGELRADFISVLADRSAVGTIPELRQEARSPNVKARQAAFRALAQIGTAKDLPALVQLLVGLPDDQGRADAEQAIIESTRRVDDPARRADVILAARPGATSVSARCSLLRVLGGVANARALNALVTAARDPEAAVQDTAARELSDWQDASALSPLATLFQSSANPTQRILALRGYLRLLAGDEELPTADKLKRFRDAMDHVRSTEEKKLVLAGLAGVADPEALKLAAPFLDDAAVRAEAAQATLQIARAVYASDRDAVKQALNRLLAAAVDDPRRQQAEAVLRQIDELSDYITAWQVAGPYFEQGKNFQALFDIAFPPEKPDTANVSWRLVPAGADPRRPWAIDLLKALGGNQRVAYLRTHIYSDKAQDARLDLGSDDGVKAWVNGKLVHANNAARPLTPDSDRVTITLQAGWNSLLLKITQNNQGWACCARLRKPDGGPLEGIRVAATPAS